MIGYFPELHPDELLYSACARYHARMDYFSHESTERDLFGRAMVKVAIDFPANLEALVHHTSWGPWKTIKQLINEHTLLPFYRPFVPGHRLPQIYEDMKGKGGSVHGRMGILTSSLRNETLRFCPVCVEHDRATIDETYWHRLPQLPGIDVCPEHRVFLENTAVNVQSLPRSQSFVTAEAVCRSVSPRDLDETNPVHWTYLWLAQNARWLLDQPHITNDAETGHQERYFALFYERGFSWYSGPVKVKRLSEAIKEYYSPALLDHLGCSLEKRYNWVLRLVHEMGRFQHPISHLLILRFLNVSAQDFFNLPARRHPFGPGPWPCLNLTSNHFGEPLIATYTLGRTSLEKKPIATFRCECGFVYYRVGPALSAAARHQATGFLTVTQPWVREFKQARLTTSILELADRFCTTIEMVENLLTHHGGFVFGSRIFNGKNPILVHLRTAKKDVDVLRRDVQRKKWLELLRNNPAARRAEVQKKRPGLSIWLSTNDREWFEEHLPARQKPAGPGPRNNWRERDLVMARRVREEAAHIRSEPGRPVRVSETSLARRIGKIAVIGKRGHLVPLTKRALNDVCESVEAYAVRRIHWAGEVLRSEGVEFDRNLIRWRAAVREKIAKAPLVRAAIEENIGPGVCSTKRPLKARLQTIA